MDHFDLPRLRYVPETAEKYRKIEGRFMVFPAVQSKKVKIIKVAHPWNCYSTGLMMAKTVLHFGPSSQIYRASKKGVPLLGAKVPYFGANLVVGSQFCLLCGQKRSK